MMDYNSLLNPDVMGLKPSGIRRFFSLAEKMKDVISLGVGEPDFKTPWNIRREGIVALEKGRTRYSGNSGMEDLRAEISAYLDKRFELKYNSENEIIVTVGGSEAIDMCIRAIVCEGDEVLIPEPCFVAYSPIVRLSRGRVIPVPTDAENEFKLTPEMLKNKITEKTKLLVLPFPNNPTGAVMRKKDLQDIADILKNTNIMVLSDEIYAELTYGERHVSISSIDGMKERTVIINGFSKAFAMTGWRLGYAAGPREIIEQMAKIHQYAIMCAPTTSQYAGIEALKNSDDNVKLMVEEYDVRRRFITNEFNKLGLNCFLPQGAFYIFPDIRKTKLTSEDFCEKLLNSQKVAVIPGNAFGESGEGFIRVSYSYSINHIMDAVEKIGQFLKSL